MITAILIGGVCVLILGLILAAASDGDGFGYFFAVALAFDLTVAALVIYVIAHFVSKYW